jgi:integrase
MPPRPRQRTAKLPRGIKPEALPNYVYFDPAGRGRWILRLYADGKLGRAVRLCCAQATLREIWDAYEHATAAPVADTLQALISQFEQSPTWADLAKSTQEDYRASAHMITSALDKSGTPLGQTALRSWTPGAVRAYVDLRATVSRSRANHELRYLARVFQWGYERDMLAANPARGVRTLKIEPRQRYVNHGEYEAFLEFVAASGRFLYLIPAAELAYLCRLRLCEVLDLQRADCQDDGLFAARRKGSRDALTEWSPRLRAAIDAALALHGNVASLYLIPSASRGRMREDAFKAAWGIMMREWAKTGAARFTFHDLKRAGVSDYDGDKLAASGHRSMAMLRVYDVLPSRAKSTR